MEELQLSIQQGDPKGIEAELGDLFFTLVNMARFLKIDPEEALRKTNQRFFERFQFMERKAKKSRASLAAMSLAEMDRLWEEAKEAEKKSLKRRNR
jgi:XTP/dITP diphosphohydrolase